jgi:acyl phosphate:glycerol-3-phosphate acyltransferase
VLTLITILLAYLVGSIPCGYLLVHFKQGRDVRDTGSGGTGATNVSRTAGKFAGVVTLVLDALKGALVIVITRQLANSWDLPVEQLITFAAIAVVVGHIFPVWLKFRGGKGVATAIGVFLVLAPIATIGALVMFFQAVLLTRYVSFGSILAISSVPLWIWLFYDSKWLLIATLAIAALVVFAHRANIRRLLNGTESKFR